MPSQTEVARRHSGVAAHLIVRRMGSGRWIRPSATQNARAGHGCCLTKRQPISCEIFISDSNSGYKHDASDKKLDHAADAEKAVAKTSDEKHHAGGPGHDPAKIARHDDAGKDRLFEHREQHDDAEKESERSRLAKDVAKHDHPV
jgi:hypothetical protein